MLIRFCIGVFICCLAIMTSCTVGGDGGRWDHYTSGGSFIGARPSMSPDGKFIVYASPRSGHGDIYRVDITGTKTTRLTNNKGYEGDPVFSPNGKTIAFVREKEGKSQIWIMQADGSGQRQLTQGVDCEDEGPSFSPDSSRIVFTRRIKHKSPGDIFQINSDGTRLTQITKDGNKNWEASFSPDGHSVLYSPNSASIWLMNKDGSKARQLSRTGASPAFSADSKRIVFISGPYGRAISTMDADGSNQKEVLRSESYMSYPSFLSDGSKLLFLMEDDAKGTGDICILRLKDSKITKVTKTQ